MAQLRSFSIIGDSNIKRNISKTNARACPQMSGSQILSCQKLEVLDEVLGRLRNESNVCILSCVTNFLTSSEEDSMVSKRIEPVLDEFAGAISDASVRRPDVFFLVAPPMYRSTPLWYREGLPEVMTRFSSAFRQRPGNLHLLPSFPTPEFEADGIHLNAYSGLEYMIHLFDSSVTLLEDLSKPCDERIPEANESTRVLEDRVMVLEQDHRRLSKEVELRAAVDAEIHDFNVNVSNESFIMITACPKILGQSTKEWQERAKKDVAPVLKELMGRDIPIEYISNATGPRPDAPVRYNVKLYSVEVSKAVRVKFGSFYTSGRDQRPTFFKPYSIRNLVTQETRVRIAILQVIGRRYRESNQGSKVQVTGYDPRPVLKITPAPNASSRKIINCTFVDAVKKYPTTFSKSDLEFIFSKVGQKQKGHLRSLFICINDDMAAQIRVDQPRSAGSSNNKESNAVDAASHGSHSSTAVTTSADIHSIDVADPPMEVETSNSSGSQGAHGSGSGSGSRPSGSRHSGSRAAPKRGPPTPPAHQPEKSSRVQ